MPKPKQQTSKEAIARAIERAGGVPKVSVVTKWPRTTIYSMLDRGICTPARAIELERLSGISRVALCPSFPWGRA
jgi:hypothetical protein